LQGGAEDVGRHNGKRTSEANPRKGWRP
jgi:hypothetical protein